MESPGRRSDVPGDSESVYYRSGWPREIASRRAIGAVGSALPSHGRGHRFESGIAHHRIPPLRRGYSRLWRLTRLPQPRSTESRTRSAPPNARPTGWLRAIPAPPARKDARLARKDARLARKDARLARKDARLARNLSPRPRRAHRPKIRWFRERVSPHPIPHPVINPLAGLGIPALLHETAGRDEKGGARPTSIGSGRRPAADRRRRDRVRGDRRPPGAQRAHGREPYASHHPQDGTQQSRGARRVRAAVER